MRFSDVQPLAWIIFGVVIVVGAPLMAWLLAHLSSPAHRWAVINEQKRLAGCRCGRPATQVRYYGPSGSWTCDEHVGVNRWVGGSDGRWHPLPSTAEEAASLERWRTDVSRQYTDIERQRGGTN